jgi:predicted solute-binding protein
LKEKFERNAQTAIENVEEVKEKYMAELSEMLEENFEEFVELELARLQAKMKEMERKRPVNKEEQRKSQ